MTTVADAQTPLSLVRRRAELVRRVATVESVTTLAGTAEAPRYVRLVLRGAELEGFTSAGADDHLRFFAPGADGVLVLPEIGPDGPVQPAPGQPRPVSREYTPVAWGGTGEDATLTLELVVHAGGHASDWVVGAQPGDTVAVGGPRGSMLIEGTPAWYLLAGDLTALPAIRRHLAATAGAPTTVLVLVAGEEEAAMVSDELVLPAGASLRVLVDADVATGSTAALAEAVTSWTPPGDPAAGFAFVAAEQSIVAPAKARFSVLGVTTHVAKGYWRLGDDEHHAAH
ncbi:siderophore-interacting protein [Nocardioides sp. GY 10127]|uniref:siderophore-interacting protein n=1 Tax=Nocardioides sp. GY 10127 TaxID=2569762 RepID=UPI0010A86110|nr:siderophore-interacting protein [Nocardioides sp. GY 10127]TIC83309.1 siderophore-interacting protein [Nocardioides sp. GY 10127]